MKKLALLLVATLLFASCSIEDDGPDIRYEYAEVISADLPESFEEGKTYRIDVTYLLPTACHNPAGIEGKRGGSSGDERRDIYIAGVASYDGNLEDCDEEADEEERTKEGTFSITIDEDEAYTFYLWVGENTAGENQYTIVEVPVVDPSGSPVD